MAREFTIGLENPADKTEDFTGRSRRPDAQEARQYTKEGDLSGIIGAFSDLLPPAVETGTTIMKSRVREQIVQTNDDINAAYGVDLSGRGRVEGEFETSLIPEEENLPADVVSAIRSMKRLEKATSLGKRSPTEFHATLSETAKRLYAQYDSPYMRDYIRSEFHKITGFDPDKSLRDAIDDARKAGDTASQRERFEKLNTIQAYYKEGINVHGMAKAAGFDLESASPEAVTAFFGPDVAALKKIEIDRAALEERRKAMRFSDEVGNMELAEAGREAVRGATAFVLKDFKATILAAKRALDTGEALTIEDRRALVGELERARQSAAIAVPLYLNEEYGKLGLTKEMFNNAKDQAMAPIDALKEALLSDVPAQTKAIVDVLALGDIQESIELLKDERVKRFQTLQKNFPYVAQNLTELFLGRKEKGLGPAFYDYVMKEKTGHHDGTRAAADTADAGKIIGDSDLTKETIRSSANDLKSHHIGEKEAKKYVKALHSDPKNRELFKKLPSRDWADYYKMLYNKDAEAVIEEKTPEDLDTFYERAADQLGTIGARWLPSIATEEVARVIEKPTGETIGRVTLPPKKRTLVVDPTTGALKLSVPMNRPGTNTYLDQWNRVMASYLSLKRDDPQAVYRNLETIIDSNLKDGQLKTQMKNAYRKFLKVEDEEAQDQTTQE